MICSLLHPSFDMTLPCLPTLAAATEALLAPAQLLRSLHRRSGRRNSSLSIITRWADFRNKSQTTKARRVVAAAEQKFARALTLQITAVSVLKTQSDCLLGLGHRAPCHPCTTIPGTTSSFKLLAANAFAATPPAPPLPCTPSPPPTTTPCAPTAVKSWTTRPPVPSHFHCLHPRQASRLTCTRATVCSSLGSTGMLCEL